MSLYLPDGCTDADVDRAAGGYDDAEPDDPENEYPMVPCRGCNDYPCRCLSDESMGEIDCPF